MKIRKSNLKNLLYLANQKNELKLKQSCFIVLIKSIQYKSRGIKVQIKWTLNWVFYQLKEIHNQQILRNIHQFPSILNLCIFMALIDPFLIQAFMLIKYFQRVTLHYLNSLNTLIYPLFY
ncbi:transmembrane protein, putative (macronuclear) [Tetrahymena thermophila SB210]|uniref:Transmembrane protein, putative n=1 Tax=Tetrahymena thermophila (strain SB210) TaxID=312017 RepID=W7WZ47_TETTS|nr:transmembrane protein, putative [Tetrahymena thermophila SB210]EWS72170.1 transmembrane protein, putative [Tetrahymena thermophila SB210]|eukprot:XP_012655301.1 transmembrane protein, putative [Tetrahymena thermophila SB210]